MQRSRQGREGSLRMGTSGLIYIELEHGLPLVYRGRMLLVEDWDDSGAVMVSYLDGSYDVVECWELEIYYEC